MESRKRKRGGDQSQSTLFFHVLWHGEVQSNPPWRTAGYAPGIVSCRLYPLQTHVPVLHKSMYHVIAIFNLGFAHTLQCNGQLSM